MDSASPPSAVPIRVRAQGALQSKRGIWLTAGLAAALALPSIGFGLVADDRLHHAKAREGGDALTFFQLSSDRSAEWRDSGFLAWWTSPRVHVRFFRPISSLTHMLEYNLWPNAPWFMHLVNVLLYAAIVAVVCGLYRELLPHRTLLAAMAGLMFAIDDSHAPSVGWIAARNTLLASLFAFAAVLLHVQARRRTTGRTLRHAGSTLSVALALGSAEAGVAAFAYLIAFALVYEQGPWLKRATTLVPQLTVFAVWSLAYVAGDFGARHVSYYRDFTSPLMWLSGILDIPVWIASLVGPSIAGALVVVPAAVTRLVALLAATPLLAAMWRASPRSREQLFFLVGALLCLLPLLTTLPQDRLTMLASFGAFGLIASFLEAARASSSRFVRAMRATSIGIHFVLAPLLFLATLNQGKPIDNGALALAAAIRAHSAPEVVLLNSPIELVPMYTWAEQLRDPSGRPPSTLHQLYAGASALTAERIDDRTLELATAEGWGRLPVERIFGSVDDMPLPGEEIRAGSMRVRVLESLEDGRPMRVRFQFATPLETDRLLLTWRGQQPVPWQPPPVGEKVPLERLSMFTSLDF